jgi:hypothetical protein
MNKKKPRQNMQSPDDASTPRLDEHDFQAQMMHKIGSVQEALNDLAHIMLHVRSLANGVITIFVGDINSNGDFIGCTQKSHPVERIVSFPHDIANSTDAISRCSALVNERLLDALDMLENNIEPPAKSTSKLRAVHAFTVETAKSDLNAALLRLAAITKEIGRTMRDMQKVRGRLYPTNTAVKV